MGLIKKAAKGTLAVGTLGASVVVEKSAKAVVSGVSAGVGGRITRQDDLSPEQVGAGVIFHGMSHDEGRNAQVTLYLDRIERVKERSRVSLSSARQDTEMTPLKSVSSVQAKKDGALYTKVTIFASGNNIEFRFRHEHALLFKNAIQELILGPSEKAAVAPAPVDVTDQLKKLADLRDSGVLTEAEFDAKKQELLSRL